MKLRVVLKDMWTDIGEIFYGLLGVDETVNPNLEGLRFSQKLISLVEEFPEQGLNIFEIEVPEGMAVKITEEWDSYNDCMAEGVSFIPVLKKEALENKTAEEIIKYLKDKGLEFGVQ